MRKWEKTKNLGGCRLVDEAPVQSRETTKRREEKVRRWGRKEKLN